MILCSICDEPFTDQEWEDRHSPDVSHPDVHARCCTLVECVYDRNKDDLIEYAWGIIANAGGGNWDTQTDEWRKAAERWRDQYHAILSEGT